MSLANPKPEPQVLSLTRRFAATREVVFRALTEPESLGQWFGPKGCTVKVISLDLRPSGAYSFEFHGDSGSFHPLTGTYLEVRAPERLVMTWVWGKGGYAGIETRVTIELKEVDGGTELTLTHENLAGLEARDEHQGGWTSTLDCLESYLA